MKIKGRTEPTDEDPLGDIESELATVEINNTAMAVEDFLSGGEFVYDKEGRWIEWQEVDTAMCERCGVCMVSMARNRID